MSLARPPGPSHPARQPLTVSPTEVTRRMSASGLIGVCYQQVSAGRYLTGQIVTVRLHPTVVQVSFAGGHRRLSVIARSASRWARAPAVHCCPQKNWFEGRAGEWRPSGTQR
jgi:hypothetical protein